MQPGGRLIITTPNTWYPRSRLQFLLRGFHSGFRPIVGRRRELGYITYFAWNFPLMHLLMTHVGYDDITLYEVSEPKPKRLIEHVLALPSRLYCRRQQCRAGDLRHARY